MDRGPMINRYIVGSSDWIEVLVLRYFCRKAAAEDRRFAMRMNLLCQEIANVCEYRRNLADELCSVRSVIVAVKVSELLNDTLMKDEAKMAQLRELERQLELRALEKELFMQRLVQNVLSEPNRSRLVMCRFEGETINAYDKKVEFIRELEAVPGIAATVKTAHVPSKMAEFLREIQMRDKETVVKLQVLVAEIELNARKKDEFIQKLKGLMPY
ncbi:hypothetical protein Tco_0444627 [Tanacetum coccineum]